MDPPSESSSADEGMSDDNGTYNNYRRKYSNGSQAGAVQRSPSAPPLRSNSIDMSSLLNSPSYDDDNMTTNEDVTNDDLQAMKNMIGDMKKDPSLLYRLSSLPGNDNTSSLPSSPSVGQHPLPSTLLPTSPGRGDNGGIH